MSYLASSFVVAFGLAMLVLSAAPGSGIPARVANRMVPSWWQHASKECRGASDCRARECCARPMLSSRAYCMPLKARSEACDVTPYMLQKAQQIHFGDCPCLSHLTCAANHEVPQCIDYQSLHLHLSRAALQEEAALEGASRE